MSRWFRMYDEILDDPKLQKLPPHLFRVWVNALALCSRNGGKLPPIADCAFAFRETEECVSSAFHALASEGLFVTVGETFQPKNWNKRQYKSDTSTGRVRAYRKRSRNGGETAPETETETETDNSEANASADVQVIDPEAVMWRHGRLYLQSQGVPGERIGTMLGKWKKDHGSEAVIVALGKAQREGAIDPVSFITRCLGANRKGAGDDRDRITV